VLQFKFSIVVRRAAENLRLLGVKSAKSVVFDQFSQSSTQRKALKIVLCGISVLNSTSPAQLNFPRLKQFGFMLLCRFLQFFVALANDNPVLRPVCASASQDQFCCPSCSHEHGASRRVDFAISHLEGGVGAFSTKSSEKV
jgi:hypothetical protein